MESKGNKKYLLLVCGFVLMLFLGLLYGWSIFRIPLMAEFADWSPTKVSLTFTLSIIFFCLGIFSAGLLIAKIKPQTLMKGAAALLIIGFGAITLLLDFEAPGKSLIVMYIFYGVLCGFGVGLSYNVLLSTVLKWFAGNVGVASGVLLMGFGLGGLVLGSVVNSLVAVIGIKNIFLPLGAVMGVLIFLTSPIIKNPVMQTAANAGAGAKAEAAPIRKDYRPTEMVKTVSFWTMFFWGICISTGGLLVINSAANISVYYGGAAVAGLIVSVFIGGSRPPIGIVFDRFGRNAAYLTATVFMLLGGVALTIGALSGSTLLIFVGIPCVGISYGSTSTLSAGAISKFFGMKYYSLNFAMNTFAMIPAALIGPIVSSRLQEAAGGDYRTTFYMLIATGAISTLLAFVLARFAKREDLE